MGRVLHSAAKLCPPLKAVEKMLKKTRRRRRAARGAASSRGAPDAHNPKGQAPHTQCHSVSTKCQKVTKGSIYRTPAASEQRAARPESCSRARCTQRGPSKQAMAMEEDPKPQDLFDLEVGLARCSVLPCGFVCARRDASLSPKARAPISLSLPPNPKHRPTSPTTRATPRSTASSSSPSARSASRSSWRRSSSPPTT